MFWDNSARESLKQASDFDLVSPTRTNGETSARRRSESAKLGFSPGKPNPSLQVDAQLHKQPERHVIPFQRSKELKALE